DYQPDLAAYDHFLRGRELLHQRDWGAGDELRQAVELDPGFAEAYAELAIDHLLGNPAKSDRDNAREAIDTALTLVPGMPRALAAKGLLLEGLSPPDYPAAEVVLRQALEQEPHMVDAMNWLAGALTQQGKKKEAKALFYRAHGYDPLHPAIATNLAQLMVEKGDAVAAKNVLSPLLEMPEPSPYVFYALRELCKDTGQLVEMNEVERRGAQRVNDQHYGLALSYAMLAMWDKAEYWMARSYREFPDFPPIAIFPSQTDQWRGRYAAGLEDLKQSVAAGGTNPTDLFWYAPIYGRYLAMAGDYQAAIDILQPYFEAERNLPGPRRDRKARHALAFALLRTGENERAKALLEPVEDFAKDPKYSASFGPAFADYYFARNAALLGKRELALERLRKAIDAGWRGYYIKDLEPLWDTLKDDPRYQAMMAEVKADVDRQRVAVEQLDAKQDLPALVDDFRAQL
ncbi:MAG: tetratricopeptide repeat protein, partial [Lysobacterales bacterium]